MGGEWGNVEKGEETPKTMLLGFRGIYDLYWSQVSFQSQSSVSLLPSRQNEADSGADLFHNVAAPAGPGGRPGVGTSDGRSSPGGK